MQLADIFDTTTDFILGRTENPNGLNFNVKDFLDKGDFILTGRNYG